MDDPIPELYRYHPARTEAFGHQLQQFGLSFTVDLSVQEGQADMPVWQQLSDAIKINLTNAGHILTLPTQLPDRCLGLEGWTLLQMGYKKPAGVKLTPLVLSSWQLTIGALRDLGMKISMRPTRNPLLLCCEFHS